MWSIHILETGGGIMLIYRCLNLKNEKCYIGKSIFSLNIRIKQHLCDMEKNKYKSTLHDALRKYSSENFSWDILWKGNCSKNWLNELEKFYIYFFDSFKSGYNMTQGGEGGPLWTKERISIERRKLAAKKACENRDNTYLKNGIFKNMTIEERRRNILKRDNSYLKGSNNPFCKLSEERKKEIIENRNKKRRLYKPTKETNLKISDVLIEKECFVGRKNPMSKKYKMVSPQGIIFTVKDGLLNFCNEMNLSFSMIRRSLKNSIEVSSNQKNLRSEKSKSTIGWRAIECQ
jgi:group I intron endonuclease